MSQAAPPKTDPEMSRRQGAILFISVGVAFITWIASLQSPIAHGKENRDKARPFLKQLFPDRILEPGDSVTAPVAAIFEVIRSEEAALARQAIDFAAAQEFGFAAPYVIERLGSGDPELERAAQAFLTEIAGADYGPDASSWRAWWRSPPRRFFGLITVPQRILTLAAPVGCGLAAVTLFFLAWKWPRPGLVEIGVALLGMAWFTGIVTFLIRNVGSFDTCTFGGKQIVYHSNHGAVVGLEDAFTGGVGLLAAGLATFVLGPFVVAIVTASVIVMWKPETEAQPREGCGTKS